ncbi:MAG TPA: BatD family protein [bacterium]|nr:BatD family protein [bacterium]
MAKIGRIFIIAGLILVPALGRADEPSLELTVDRTTASPGEPITAQVTVSGLTSPPQPVLKNADAFEIRPLGTSSQIQIVNGRYSASKTFQFQLMPRNAGEFTIGPAEITVGGKTYQSGTVTLTVAKGAQAPATPQEAGDRMAFVTAEVSETNPYVHQQIVYTFRFYSRVPLRGSELKAPDFSGFQKEQLGDVRHTQKVINGQTWDVNEIRWALFPVAPGETEIGPTEVDADLLLPSRRGPFRDPFFGEDPLFGNDPFFNGMFQPAQRRRFSADPIAVNVRPLPSEGRPGDFAGFVGTPRLSAQLSARDVEVGESATLTLSVQGNGDIRDVPAPRLDGGSDFKTYDDEPSFKSATGNQGLEGTKTFKKAIVPLRTGEMTLPPFRLSYFDPKTGQYQTVATDPIPIHVRPSSHPESTNLPISGGSETKKQEVTVLAHDLMPIDRGLSALGFQDVSPKMRSAFLLAAFVPFLGFLIAWQWRRRLDRIRSDSGFLKRERASKTAWQGVRNLGRATDREFPERAAHILRGFLGDKAGIDGGSLTPADVHARLEPLHVSRETRDAVRRFLEECDEALYGGQPVTAEFRKRLAEELGKLVERAGKEIRT